MFTDYFFNQKNRHPMPIRTQKTHKNVHVIQIVTIGFSEIFRKLGFCSRWAYIFLYPIRENEIHLLELSHSTDCHCIK